MYQTIYMNECANVNANVRKIGIPPSPVKTKNFSVGFSFCPFGFSYYVPLAHPSPNNKCDAPAGATGCQPTAEFTPPGKIPPNAHNWGEKQHEPGSQG